MLDRFSSVNEKGEFEKYQVIITVFTMWELW
jgi:hypothetical protein